MDPATDPTIDPTAICATRRAARSKAALGLLVGVLGLGVPGVAAGQVTVAPTQSDDCMGTPCKILGPNAAGYLVVPDAPFGILYNVSVEGDTPSISYQSTTGEAVPQIGGAYLIIHQAGTVTGPVFLDDVGAVANNGTIAATGSAAVTILKGDVGSFANGGAIVINGELNEPGQRVIQSDDRALALEGAFLVENRGMIEGAIGVEIEPDDPGPLPMINGIDIDLSFIPELTDLDELPNEIRNAGTIEGTVGAGIVVGNALVARPKAVLINSASTSEVIGATDGFVILGFGEVDNSGLITGTAGSGVVIDRPATGYGDGNGDENVPLVVNRLTSAADRVGRIEGEVHAISIQGAGRVDNLGYLVSSTGTVVLFEGVTGADNANLLNNSGTIEFGDGGAGPAAVSTENGADTFINGVGASVRMGAGAPVALSTVISMGSGTDSVTNEGTIDAPAGWTAIELNRGNDNFTNSTDGVIGATAGIAVAGNEGDDVITSSGTISAPGGVAIDGGEDDDIVNLRTGSLVTGTVQGGLGNDSLILDGNGTLTGNVFDFTNLQVTSTGGSGVAGGDWRIDGDVVASRVEVTSGMLTFSGTMSLAGGVGGTVAVQSGGVLAGNGTIQAPVEIFGVLAPGRLAGSGATGTVALIDRLDIDGRLDLEAGSVLSIDFTETTNDVLGVTGDVVVEDGALVRFIAVDPDTTENKPLAVFLEHGGALTGTLEAEASAVFDFEIVGPADDPIINPGQLGFRFTRRDFVDLVSANHVSLATILDAGRSLPPTDELAAAYVELDAFPTAAQVNEFHGQMSPELMGFTPIVAFESARGQIATLTRHLREMRLAERGRSRLRDPDERLERAITRPKRDAWRPSVTMLGEFSSRAQKGPYDGFDALGGGMALGVDGFVLDSLITGISVSTVYHQIESSRYDQRSQLVTPRIAAYAGYLQRGVYVDGILGYGFHWVQTDRRIRGQALDVSAESDHFGNELDAYLGVGYLYDWGKWNVGPSLSFQYLALYEDAYDESKAGTLSLDIESEKTGFANSRLGLRASRGIQLDPDTRVISQLRFDWAREWQHERKTIDATLSGLDERFSTQTSRMAEDWLSAGIGLKAFLENSVVIEFDYQLDASLEGDFSHSLSALWTVQF